MRLIIEARLEGAQATDGKSEATIIAAVERESRSVADLGLTLAEGRALVAGVQAMLVSRQTAGWMAGELACSRCGYGARYYKGLPISSSIAESAVNQVVSHRMAKKQQMRWTDEGAHRLAQVRVADLNGELSVKRLVKLAKMPSANCQHARQAA